MYKVMLIDDEKSLHMAIEKLLTKSGYEYCGATDAESGLEMLSAEKPDLLLLDEPFSALDYLTRVDMQEWLLHQWEYYHKTILFITHDVEEAIFLSKTIYIIQDRPFSQMERVEVPLSYPRNREDLKRADIVELKETLIEKLRRSVMNP